jgi:motility quorum-sensing regulator / GCU-specific mRNA interferase toxin
MEKATPHCKLQVVKALVNTGRVRATTSAYQGALEVGVTNLASMCAVISDLTNADFHKSMTTYADHRIWQDVYRAKAPMGEIYVKLTVIDDVLIVSFKGL